MTNAIVEILDFMEKNKEKEFTATEINKKLNMENSTTKLLRLYQQRYLIRENKIINGYRRFVYKYKE
ncbi:MAG: hypothetical protein Q7R52_00200 [archaeon]|nr:hypothetical protein [archaeon]